MWFLYCEQWSRHNQTSIFRRQYFCVEQTRVMKMYSRNDCKILLSYYYFRTYSFTSLLPRSDNNFIAFGNMIHEDPIFDVCLFCFLE